MISRYNRRPVSHKLEIRGLSRSSLNHHPPPEEADTQNLQCSLQDVEEVITIRHGSETSCASSPSDCPTGISVASSQSWSGIRSSTGTGISTERSSVFSWGYDEFDKAASRQVQQMFEEIDKQLYEGEGSGVGILPGLQDECQQWAERFPHLRILGTQLVCPSDEGFQWYEVSSSIPSVSQKSPDKEGGSTELNVKGRSAAMQKSNSADPNGSGDRPRVIEAEGHIEEYLAFDSISLEDEWKCSQPCLRPRCMPPVSPYRCRRQAVLDHLFDDVWRQLVGCTRELVQRQWEGHATDDERPSRRLSPPPLFATLPAMLPKVRQSRAPPLPTLTTGLQFQRSKGSKHKSRWKSKKQKRPTSAGKVQHNLNDLITIHSIPLQQRNLAALDRTQETEESVPLSQSPVGKPRTRRVLEYSSSSLTRPPQSARRRNLPPRTLQPLAPSLSQSSTMGSMDEIIRGTRLPTASDRLMSPLFALSRNMLLPPIGAGEVGSEQQPKAAQRQKGLSSRAHSAVNDEVASSIPRDRLYPLDVFSRPNTTHTYRSDTPYRRSFTVLDNIGQGRPGRASVATDSLGIGVTGVSLGIASSSFLDSFSHHHPLGHWPIRDEELHAPLPAPVVPTSVPPRSHSRGGFSSRLSRPGL
ncbi:protein FAM149B1 isoform X1 [Nerophis lumbriciformis]|uniref:protein FAM149B1 isoform X1 n=1 Tax=Nerophis lumbriciformis TaxID=546530 RepID=UPI002ADFF4DE|nr:protein FAM149B1-like isoform X1 [Nerophis lumbriciformis]